MPSPQSPRHSRSEDAVAGSLGTDLASTAVSCTPLFDHSHDTPARASTRSSAETSPMTTTTTTTTTTAAAAAATVDQPPRPQEGPILPPQTTLDEAVMMHWPAHNDFSMNPTRQGGGGGGVGYAPTPFPPSTGDYYYCPNDASFYNDSFNLTHSTQYTSPRSCNNMDLSGLSRNIHAGEAYPPSAYYLEPPKHLDATMVSDFGSDDNFMQVSDDYEHQYGPQSRPTAHNAYLSPYSDMTRASTPHDNHSPYPLEFDAHEDAAIDKDQPYAQLIYQALLQADNHTMILRDIYEWFKKNTDKATMSETKGWQNSIRHNLSMNGAFEKVDQPCEDSRKGYMWRLTEEALREGVKSTTRYRSKQPNKRGHRLQQPQPQRQASGAKGGQASRRSANLKRNKRMNGQYRSEPYDPRHVPSAFNPNYSTTMPYPPSPYYGSDMRYDHAIKQEQQNMLDFPIKQEQNPFDYPIKPDQTNNSHFDTSLPGGESLDFFSSSTSTTTPYNGATLPYVKAFGDSIYSLAQSPSEPSFTNSPSPSASEPRTPLSQNGGWSEDVSMGMPCIFEDMAFSEFAC